MGKRILVVDDSKTSLMMTTMILKSACYEVLTANNGEEGVNKALSEKPDLIVMDIVMPKMDGFEACRRLRHIEPTQDIPIIMVTTRGESGYVESGYECGCSDYLTKPINGIELLIKVRNQIGEQDAS